MKTLYLFRHGESVANAGGQALPNHTIPLTDIGHHQAQTLLERWQATNITPSHIYHSEFLRTQQTAMPFCRFYHMTGQSLACLNEFSCLDFDKIAPLSVVARRQLAAEYWQNATLDYKDGKTADSFQEFITRVDDFIGQLDGFADNSLFFGHGIWIGLLAYRLMNLPLYHNHDIKRFRNIQNNLPMSNTTAYRLQICGATKQLSWFDI